MSTDTDIRRCLHTAFKQYKDNIKRNILADEIPRQDVEELVAEVFLGFQGNFVKGTITIDPDNPDNILNHNGNSIPIGAYLGGIARFRCADYWDDNANRKEYSESELVDSDRNDSIFERAAETNAQSPEEMFEALEDTAQQLDYQNAIRPCVDKLSDKHFALFLMYFVQEKTLEEIAQTCGPRIGVNSHPTASRQIKKALLQLKRCIERAYAEAQFPNINQA